MDAYPEMLRRTAIVVLQEHAFGRRCRACRTAGVCPRAALAANNLDFLGDPPGWLVVLSRRSRCDDPAIVREVLAGLRGSPPELAAAESNRSVFPRGAVRVSPVPRAGTSSAAATTPQPWPTERR